MISAGEVGAVFIIKDEASAVLKRLIDQFNALEIKLDQVKKSFAELRMPSGLNRSIGNMERGLQGVAEQATRAADLTKNGFRAIDASVAHTAEGVAALKREMAGLGRVGGGGVGAAVGGGGGHGGSGRRPGQSAGAGPFHAHVAGAGPIGMRSHDNMFMGTALAGFGAWEALKASADLQQVQENLKAGGVSSSMIDKATDTAYAMGEKFGLSARDVLQGVNEIRNPLNKGTSADEGVADALKHMNTLSEAAVVLKAQGGKGGGDTAGELYDLVKSAEFRNAIGDKQFDAAVNSMVKADVATGGIVTPRTFLQMSQMLKSALPGLNDKSLYEIMPELAQEFKGQQAGTAAASLYQQLISGQMRTKGLNLLAGLGLVNDDKVEFDKVGRLKSANPGFYKDADTFRADPMKGMFDLIEAMKAHGITAEGDQRDMLSNLFGNRNAAQMAQTLAFQYGRLNRGAQGIENTKDISTTAADLLANNPKTNWNEFAAAATNAGAAIGGDLMPSATAALKQLTATINGAGALFRGEMSAGNLNKSLFGTSDVPPFMKWIEHNWQSDQRLFGGGSGPHPAPGPGPLSERGRDPRSPNTPLLAYTSAAKPPDVHVEAPKVDTKVDVKVTLDGAAIAAAVMTHVTSAISAAIARVSGSVSAPAMHDGQMGPPMPDHGGGGSFSQP